MGQKLKMKRSEQNSFCKCLQTEFTPIYEKAKRLHFKTFLFALKAAETILLADILSIQESIRFFCCLYKHFQSLATTLFHQDQLFPLTTHSCSYQ